MFLDEAIIDVAGGHGGPGCVSWRKEKYVPKGGPDGGDGGRGGDVYLVVDDNTDTLSFYASKKHFKAQKGQFGMGSNKHGRDGEDLFLKVPPGTIVTDISEAGSARHMTDLMQAGEQLLVAKGGRGGYGNAHFKSSVRQRPDFAELGEPGKEHTLQLELKLIADVGIIGYPSVGKSTLISVISAAKPKIADYPFTTIVPNLGVVQVDDRSYIVCDVPGLIEGASEGKGLGDQFLKHIERCGVLLHMLDIGRALENGKMDVSKLLEDHQNIRKELAAFSPALSGKEERIVLNKADLITMDATEAVKQLEEAGLHVFAVISAATAQGTEDLKKRILPDILRKRSERHEQEKIGASKELPVLKPHLESDKMEAFRLEEKGDGGIVVKGKRIEQFAAMTNFESEGARMRFMDVLERTGLKRAIEKQRKEGASVHIGKIRVDAYL